MANKQDDAEKDQMAASPSTPNPPIISKLATAITPPGKPRSPRAGGVELLETMFTPPDKSPGRSNEVDATSFSKLSIGEKSALEESEKANLRIESADKTKRLDAKPADDGKDMTAREK